MKTLSDIREIALNDARDYMMGEISTKTLVERTAGMNMLLEASLYAAELVSYLSDGADMAYRNALAYYMESLNTPI